MADKPKDPSTPEPKKNELHAIFQNLGLKQYLPEDVYNVVNNMQYVNQLPPADQLDELNQMNDAMDFIISNLPQYGLLELMSVALTLRDQIRIRRNVVQRVVANEALIEKGPKTTV